MKIDGKAISSIFIEQLKQRVDNLKEGRITPHLYIITFGKDTNTESYLKQKILRANQIGAKITIKRFPKSATENKILKFIDKLNKDKKIQGVIVQRPLPKKINSEKISMAVTLAKDVDGFHPHSTFGPPVALAVVKAIESTISDNSIYDFLMSKKIVILGKGTTAGAPTIKLFKQIGIKLTVIDSKTKDRKKLLKKADVIICAVGKKILTADSIKRGAILIGLGMHTLDGKLKGDYEESDVEAKASFYTPTPGGIGPINVTMLMKNLVEATEQ